MDILDFITSFRLLGLFPRVFMRWAYRYISFIGSPVMFTSYKSKICRREAFASKFFTAQTIGLSRSYSCVESKRMQELQLRIS